MTSLKHKKIVFAAVIRELLLKWEYLTDRRMTLSITAHLRSYLVRKDCPDNPMSYAVTEALVVVLEDLLDEVKYPSPQPFCILWD